MDTKCPVCGREAYVCPDGSRRDLFVVSCEACGDYSITDHAKKFLPEGSDQLLRRRFERYLWETNGKEDRLVYARSPIGGWTGPMMGFDLAAKLYEDDGSPLTKYEETIRRLASKARKVGQTFNLHADRWLFPTMDDHEAESIWNTLTEDGLIEGSRHGGDDAVDFVLTGKGLTSAVARREAGNMVFIAASFTTEMAGAHDAIAGVIDDLGYKPFLVNRERHNDIIELQIYQRIRESRFVVADLTWNRQSVYYEIGFAHGLGLEVVLTCRNDCFEHGTEDEVCTSASFAGKPCDYKKVHFDLNHRNILRWENEQGLADTLRNHIYQLWGPYKA